MNTPFDTMQDARRLLDTLANMPNRADARARTRSARCFPRGPCPPRRRNARGGVSGGLAAFRLTSQAKGRTAMTSAQVSENPRERLRLALRPWDGEAEAPPAGTVVVYNRRGSIHNVAALVLRSGRFGVTLAAVWGQPEHACVEQVHRATDAEVAVFVASLEDMDDAELLNDLTLRLLIERGRPLC